MRTVTERNRPPRLRTGFLLLPKTLTNNDFPRNLETRWWERTSWVERWIGQRWPGATNPDYFWKAQRWATPDEVTANEVDRGLW